MMKIFTCCQRIYRRFNITEKTFFHLSNYFLFLSLVLFLSCKTLDKQPDDYNFISETTSYWEGKLVEEYIYDSKKKEYIVKETDSDWNYQEIKVSIELTPDELKRVYALFLKLKRLNPNSCIYNITDGSLSGKSSIRFYRDINNKKINDYKCNIDPESQESQDEIDLSHEIQKILMSKDSYKEKFKWDFITR